LVYCEINIVPYIGKIVQIDCNNYYNIDKETLLKGKIESQFGKSGKFNIVFQEKFNIDKNDISNLKFKLKYKINIFDKDKKWIQDL
jgi:hypothetical protein